MLGNSDECGGAEPHIWRVPAPRDAPGLWRPLSAFIRVTREGGGALGICHICHTSTLELLPTACRKGGRKREEGGAGTWLLSGLLWCAGGGVKGPFPGVGGIFF